jgi:streptomycin 6-kinase
LFQSARTLDAYVFDRYVKRWDLLAWTGLSAAWMIEDEIDPGTPLEVAKLAVLELGL